MGFKQFVVMVMYRFLTAVKVSGYIIRLAGSGLSRGVQNRPAHRLYVSVWHCPYNAVCPDGYTCHDFVYRRKKIAATRPGKLFLKIGPSRKFAVLPSWMPPTTRDGAERLDLVFLRRQYSTEPIYNKYGSLNAARDLYSACDLVFSAQKAPLSMRLQAPKGAATRGKQRPQTSASPALAVLSVSYWQRSIQWRFRRRSGWGVNAFALTRSLEEETQDLSGLDLHRACSLVFDLKKEQPCKYNSKGII